MNTNPKLNGHEQQDTIPIGFTREDVHSGFRDVILELTANTALTGAINRRLDEISDILITNENSVIKSLSDTKATLKEVQTITTENSDKIDRLELERLQSDKQTRGFLVQAIITVFGCLFAFGIAQLFSGGLNVSDVKVPQLDPPPIDTRVKPRNIPTDDGIFVKLSNLARMLPL